MDHANKIRNEYQSNISTRFPITLRLKQTKKISKIDNTEVYVSSSSTT